MNRVTLTQRSLRCAVLMCFACLLLVSGCGRYAGLAYFMGAGRKTKIEAEFELPEGKVLVLVDDPAERVIWPRARQLLEHDLGEELLIHKAVKSVISPDSVARFRQSDQRFERYSASTLGDKLGADTIIWLEVREFFAPIEIEDTSTAAKIAVSIKVLTTHEEKRSDRVRLWPDDEGGQIVETVLNAVDVHKIKGDNGVSRELARRAAIRIGRLFYDHTVGDVDDEDV